MPIAPRLAIAIAASLQGVGAETAALYDPDRVPGTTETLVEQGFEAVSSDLFNQDGFYAAGDGVTAFDSGPGDEQVASFYTHGLITGNRFHPAAQTLDRLLGFRVSIDLAVEFESNDGTDLDGDGAGDAAGFSLAVISSDILGIGIQFWGDRVWATEPVVDEETGETLLVQGEGIGQPTASMASLRRYDIEVKGGVYRVRADGATLLTGPLRDYSGFGGVPTPFGTLNNFDKPNSITFGDATRVSRSRVQIGDVTSETPYQPRAEDGPVAIAATAGGVELSWPSAPGLQYSVRSGESLEFFEEFGDPVATGFVTGLVDDRPGAARRFYRIVPPDPQ